MKYAVYIAFVVLSLAGTPLHAEDFNPSNQHKSSGPRGNSNFGDSCLEESNPKLFTACRHELQKEQRMRVGLLLHD